MAGHHRGRGLPPDATDALARLGAGAAARCSSKAAHGCARSIIRVPDETDWLETVNREVTATRRGVGVCDVSTFGKIEIEGAEAGYFLDRVCANTLSTLPVGKARYVLMLREDGFVHGRRHDRAACARALRHDEHDRERGAHDAASRILPSGAVALARRADGLGLRAVGAVLPSRVRARATCCASSSTTSSMSADAAFPHLAARELTVSGVPARLFRLSFSGELAYELAVPARYGDAVIRAIMAAGEPSSASRPMAPRRSA